MKFLGVISATLLAVSQSHGVTASPVTNFPGLQAFVEGVTARDAAVNSTVASFHTGTISQSTAVTYIRSNASAIGALARDFHDSLTDTVATLNSTVGGAIGSTTGIYSPGDLKNIVTMYLADAAYDTRNTVANAQSVPGALSAFATGPDPTGKIFTGLQSFLAAEGDSLEEFVYTVECVINIFLYLAMSPLYLPVQCPFLG